MNERAPIVLGRNQDQRSHGRGLTMIVLVTLGLASCSSADAADRGANEGSTDAMEQSLAAASPVLYYEVTRDVRRCVSPLCGGFFVKAVNRPLTRCADGTSAERCYVASIDWKAAGGDPGFSSQLFVVQGTVQPKQYPPFGNLGLLVAVDAWEPATNAAPAGAYYRLADNGIVCITEPCFSIDAQLLNRNSTMQISGLDLSAVGATQEELDRAREALQEGKLIASGKIAREPLPLAIGLELRASQFFLSSVERCYSDAECGEGERCNAGEVCLPPPGCLPGQPCPAVCTGFCVPSGCRTDADCPEAQYCASDDLCHDDGTCGISADCNLDGNSYPHIECVGYGVCDSLSSTCGYQCGDPRCLDLKGHDFGPCDAVLGWGVIGGQCASISGCSASPFELFATEGECTAACARR